MELSRENRSSFKLFFLFIVILILISYMWSNCYLFYSSRFSGKIKIYFKEKPDSKIFFVNLDNIFPPDRSKMDALVYGLDKLEKHPKLKKIIEKHKILKMLF